MIASFILLDTIFTFGTFFDLQILHFLFRHLRAIYKILLCLFTRFALMHTIITFRAEIHQATHAIAKLLFLREKCLTIWSLAILKVLFLLKLIE